jgi:hypothetical protein
VRWRGGQMIKIKVVYSRRHETINIYIYGLEQVFKILEKYGFEQGDGENGVLWWFGYPEDVGDIMKFVDELKKTNAIVEYVEE